MADLTWGRVGRRNGAKASTAGASNGQNGSSGGGHRLALRSGANGSARNGSGSEPACRPSGSGESPPNGAASKGHKISANDIQMVQNLIERCLQLHLNQKEVIQTLQQHSKIEPSFTALVWQKLEEQNPDFFKVYYTRLRLKDQIMHFNVLLEQHSMQVQAFGGGPLMAAQPAGTGLFPFMATPGTRDVFGVNELFPDQPGLLPFAQQAGTPGANGRGKDGAYAAIQSIGGSVPMFHESHDVLGDDLAHFHNGYGAGTLSLSDLTADLATHITDADASLPMLAGSNGVHADPSKDSIIGGGSALNLDGKGKLPYTFSLSDMNLVEHLDMQDHRGVPP